MSAISSAISSGLGGLNTAADRLAVTSSKIATLGADDGNLTGDVVDLIGEKTQFKASALVVKTADRMLGNLLDVLDTDPRS